MFILSDFAVISKKESQNDFSTISIYIVCNNSETISNKMTDATSELGSEFTQLSIDSSTSQSPPATGNVTPRSVHRAKGLPPISRDPSSPLPTRSPFPPISRPAIASPGTTKSTRKKPGTLADIGYSLQNSPFNNYSRFVDPSGKLNFSGKAVIHSSGVDFSNGNSFQINLADLEIREELGKGQYGTVKKVLHKTTNVTMAMKEIRLELEEASLNQILMELDVLHKSTSPYIVEFYGAFFIETCVYYCMEFMDAGSLDKLYGLGVEEPVMGKIAVSMVKGLRFLKDDLNIIHRDVKPTNVLINMHGHIKLCDFGVSGQLEKSLAKTKIGCQPYMAPERIKAEDTNPTYTVASDVWSLGVSLVEAAGGKYPYAFDNVFAQLESILRDEPPTLPDSFSDSAKNFISECLNKVPTARPNYGKLLEHPFLQWSENVDVDMSAWATKAYEYRLERERQEREKAIEKGKEKM